LKIGILKFSGIKPVNIKTFGPIKSSDDIKRKLWLKEAEELGKVQGKI
jgi:hypothetical protein